MARKRKLPEGFSSKFQYDVTFERGKDADGHPAIFLKTAFQIGKRKHEFAWPLPDTPESVDACIFMEILFEKWFNVSVFYSLLGLDEEIYDAAMIEMIEMEPLYQPIRGMTKEYKKDALQPAKDAAEFIRKRHKSLGFTRTRGGKKAKADLSLLWFHYEGCLMFWRSATELYKALQRSTAKRLKWRAEIKEAFPPLPEDLIERLAPVSDWPTEIAELCEDSSGNAVEDIAIEHAARICGSSPYAYKLETLREYLKRQKRGKSQTIH